MDEAIVNRINILWKDLKSIEDLGKSNNLQKRELSLLKTKRGFAGFEFNKGNKSITLDKNTNRYGTQFRIVLKENDNITESFMITEDGKIVKNAKNGFIPRVGNLTYVKEGDFSNEALETLHSYIKELEAFSTEYKNMTEEKILNNSKPKVFTESDSKPIGIQYNDVKATMDNAVSDLENALDEIKKNFGVINRFNDAVDKVKKDFKNFLSKIK